MFYIVVLFFLCVFFCCCCCCRLLYLLPSFSFVLSFDQFTCEAPHCEHCVTDFYPFQNSCFDIPFHTALFVFVLKQKNDDCTFMCLFSVCKHSVLAVFVCLHLIYSCNVPFQVFMPAVKWVRHEQQVYDSNFVASIGKWDFFCESFCDEYDSMQFSFICNIRCASADCLNAKCKIQYSFYFIFVLIKGSSLF